MQDIREYWLILLTTPLYILVIGAEMLLSHWNKQDTYTWKNTLANVYLMLANAGLDLLVRTVYVLILAWCWNQRIMDIETVWIYWLVLLVSEDFLYYWLHRLGHMVRLFWAVHVTHHSSEKYNLSVGFRSSVFEPMYRFIFFMPLAFLGFRPLDILFIYSATQIWGILVHTDKVGKLGWLEYIFVTPSHHRVHHASNTLYLDRNMGMFLIFWDKLFGTFVEERPAAEYESIRYGLTAPIDFQGPLHIIFHEWAEIGRDLQQKIPLKDKLFYVFGPPGWSHNGSRRTSKELRLRERID